MGNTPRINQKLYTNILKEILDTNKYQDIRNKFPIVDSTFSEQITYLKSINLIRIYKKRNKTIYIYYKGCTSFIFKTFFLKELTKYKTNTKPKYPKISYKSKDMEILIKEFLIYELKTLKQETGIKDLFERLIIDSGNQLIIALDKYKTFRNHYYKFRKLKQSKTFKQLYSMNDNDMFYNLLLLEQKPNKVKIDLVKQAFSQIHTIENIDAIVLFKLFALNYSCTINKIDIKILLKNFIPKTKYNKHKQTINKIYGIK